MIISSSAAQRHCSKVLQMPQLQNHRAQATMRLQFQQQQPPVTRLLHPRLHRTAAACLLKIMIKFKIKFEIIFVKLKLKSFRIQETPSQADIAAENMARVHQEIADSETAHALAPQDSSSLIACVHYV